MNIAELIFLILCIVSGAVTLIAALTSKNKWNQ